MSDLKPTSTCPVCAGECTVEFANAVDYEYGTCPGEVFYYRRCQHCHSVYLEHPPADRLREIYPPTYYSFSARNNAPSIIERVKEYFDGRLFRSVLRRLHGDQLAILDVGGGTGWLLSVIRRLSPRVMETHEVDIDDSAREPAVADGHIFHCTRIEDFRPPRQFHLITMLNLIEHVPNPAVVLRAACRALAPGGLILLKTPNVDTLDQRIFRHLNWGGYHCPRHFVLFNKRSFTGLAERCGLSCVWSRYTQGGPQWSISVLALLARLGIIRAGPGIPLARHRLFMPLAAIFAAFDFARLPLFRTAQMIVLLQANPRE